MTVRAGGIVGGISYASSSTFSALDLLPAISNIGTADTVTDGQLAFSVTGVSLSATSYAVASFGPASQQWAVTSANSTTVVITEAVRGNNLPFTTADYPALTLSLYDVSDNLLASRSFEFNPASGYVAYDVSADPNVTVGESVLATVGAINAGSQLLVPTTIGGFAVTWELDGNGEATGAIEFLAGVLVSPTSLTGGEYRDGTTRLWDDLVATLVINETASRDISYTITNRLERGTAASIFAAGDADTSWTIHNIDGRDTSWMILIRNQFEKEVEWAIFANAEHDTEWAITQGGERDTEYQVFNGVNQVTRWLIDGRIVVGQMIFNARPRRTLFQARQRQ